MIMVNEIPKGNYHDELVNGIGKNEYVLVYKNQNGILHAVYVDAQFMFQLMFQLQEILNLYKVDCAALENEARAEVKTSDVSSFLACLNLSELSEIFEREELFVEDILRMTTDELKDIGVDKVEHRKLIIEEAEIITKTMVVISSTGLGAKFVGGSFGQYKYDKEMDYYIQTSTEETNEHYQVMKMIMILVMTMIMTMNTSRPGICILTRMVSGGRPLCLVRRQAGCTIQHPARQCHQVVGCMLTVAGVKMVQEYGMMTPL